MEKEWRYECTHIPIYSYCGSTRRHPAETTCDKYIIEASFYRWKTEVQTKSLTISGQNYLEGQGISFLNF